MFSKKKLLVLWEFAPVLLQTGSKLIPREYIVGSRAKPGVKSADAKLLSDAQEQAVQHMIIDRMPDQLKLNFSLWTRQAVKELVDRELGVVLAISTMGAYLRKWGFTPQKPK